MPSKPGDALRKVAEEIRKSVENREKLAAHRAEQVVSGERALLILERGFKR